VYTHIHERLSLWGVGWEITSYRLLVFGWEVCGSGRVIGQMGPARKYFLYKQRVAIWHVLSSLLQEVSRMPRSAVRRYDCWVVGTCCNAPFPAPALPSFLEQSCVVSHVAGRLPQISISVSICAAVHVQNGKGWVLFRVFLFHLPHQLSNSWAQCLLMRC